MLRLRTKAVRLVSGDVLSCIPKPILTVTLSLLLGLAGAFAQKAASLPTRLDTLGAHNVGGRGCAACHPPHVPASAESGLWIGIGLWQTTPSPRVRQTVLVAQGGNPLGLDSVRLLTSGAEVAGVVLCVSCHDGNITPQNMLANRPYEAAVGLSPSSASAPLPTLLDDTRLPGRAVDHPFGPAAHIEVGSGLIFRNGEFAVIPGTPYAQFVANYGWPSLAPKATQSNPYGIDEFGRPYLVCTTCHNQHAMSSYASSLSNPIAGDSGNGRYATFFFVNGPYNPNSHTTGQITSPSSTQFCRQCHFRFSNEAHNVNTVRTLF